MIQAIDLVTILLMLGGILSVLLAAVARTRRSLQEGMTRALVFYAALSGLWELGQAAGRAFRADEVTARITLYGAFLLALLFLHLNRSFVMLAGPGWGWWALGVTGMAALVVLDRNLLALPEVVRVGSGWTIQQQRLAWGTAILGWGVFMTGAALLTLRAYRRLQQPLHRNRIQYWLVVLGFTVAGDGLRFAGQEAFGSGLRLLATGLATYALTTHRLPDVRQIARQTLIILGLALVMGSIYTLGYVGAGYLLRGLPDYGPWLAGALMALVLVILFNPLAGLVRRWVNRLISRAGYDPSRMLREYSLTISNILDVERLGAVVVGLIQEAMGSRHGALFLVDRANPEDEPPAFHLRRVAHKGSDEMAQGLLAGDSPITHYLRHEQRPLTQYDMDLLPRFRGASPEERAWLVSLGMDVYVPIYAKGEWIGLLTLGPKVTRDRYFDDDLVLLSTLADQTAVALKNARLVEDLVRLNEDLKRAYASVEQANRQLQELDKLKSSFLGVITHELRTPFANIAMALQLLERYGVEPWTADQREQLEQVKSGVQTARAMVDNLIAFATFLSKQGELHLAPLDFAEVVEGALEPLESMAERKGLALEVAVPRDLPRVDGDRERLAEAVHHLVHNAIKFTEAGKVSVACWATDTAITFEVKDTGVSIPADKLSNLWKSFEQMADPLRRGVEGLGLGLALVKYVITAHSGEVWAHSTEGVGSTFGFYIPLRKAKPVAVPQRADGAQLK